MGHLILIDSFVLVLCSYADQQHVTGFGSKGGRLGGCGGIKTRYRLWMRQKWQTDSVSDQLTYNSFFIWPVFRSLPCSLARLLAICKMKLQRWNNSRNIYVLENVKSCTTCTAQHSSVQCCGGECLRSDISISSGYEVSDTPISRYHFNINIMLDTISISAAGTHCPLHLHHTSGAALQQ